VEMTVVHLDLLISALCMSLLIWNEKIIVTAADTEIKLQY